MLILNNNSTLKGVKLKTIIIDYINILSNYRNPNTENTYMKIKQIAEDLRAMAVFSLPLILFIDIIPASLATF